MRSARHGGQARWDPVPTVRTMEPLEVLEQRRGMIRCGLSQNPSGCGWRPDCRGKLEMGSGKEAGGPACSGVRCSQIPDVGGRSISYFKKCAFGFRFCLLFKASASGVLLMGVMERFEYDYFNEKAK